MGEILALIGLFVVIYLFCETAWSAILELLFGKKK